MKKQIVTLVAMSVSLFSMVDAQNHQSSYQQNSAYDQANQQNYYNQTQQNPYYQTNQQDSNYQYYQQNQDKRSKNYVAQETPFAEEPTTIYPVERGSTSSITQQSRNDRQFQSRGFPDPEQAGPRNYNQTNEAQNQWDQNFDPQGAEENNQMFY